MDEDLARLSAACLNGDTEAVRAELQRRSADTSDRGGTADKRGLSPLHIASRENHAQIVDLLLLHGHGGSLLSETQDGDTPLHVACASGSSDAVRRLLQEVQEEDAASQCTEGRNRAGNTPLHLACENGHLSVVTALLESGFCTRDSVLSINQTAGATPFGLAVEHSHWEIARRLLEELARLTNSPTNPAVAFKDFRDHFPSQSAPLKCLDRKPLKVVVVGDSLSGKSTLIKSLQTHGFLSRCWRTLAGVGTVDSHRSGIVVTTVEYCSPSPHHCITFFDVTGHREQTPETLVKYTGDLTASECVFVITVDVRDPPNTITSKLLYWFDFTRRVFNSEVTTSAEKTRVLVIGSFTDRTFHVMNPLTAANADIPSQYFSLQGRYTLDCRSVSPISWKINQVRRILHLHPYTLHRREPACYLLCALLHSIGRDTPVISLSDLSRQLMENTTEKKIEGLLPREHGKLLSLCRSLHEVGQILFFQSRSGEHWIVLDTRQVLSDINHTCLPQLRQYAHHGLVHSNKVLRLAGRTGAYPSAFFQDFLTYFDFCRGVSLTQLHQLQKDGESKMQRQPHSDSDVRARLFQRRINPLHVRSQSLTNPSSESSEAAPGRSQSESHDPEMTVFFFPGLLSADPVSPWELAEGCYSFSWILKSCIDQNVFFSIDFINNLIFNLMHKFAPPRSSDTHTNNTSIYRQCTPWQNGVSWSNGGVTTCVAIHDNQYISLSMWSLAGHEMRCLQLRNQIMEDILELSRDFCPEVSLAEFFAPGSGRNTLPVINPNDRSLVLYSKECIRREIERGSARDIAVSSSGSDPIPLTTLLYFEPCAVLSKELRGILTREENATVTLDQEFCFEFAQRLDSDWEKLASHFGLPSYLVSEFRHDCLPHQQAMNMLNHLIQNTQNTYIQTYDHLRQALKKISIFGTDDWQTSLI